MGRKRRRSRRLGSEAEPRQQSREAGAGSQGRQGQTKTSEEQGIMIGITAGIWFLYQKIFLVNCKFVTTVSVCLPHVANVPSPRPSPFLIGHAMQRGFLPCPRHVYIRPAYPIAMSVLPSRQVQIILTQQNLFQTSSFSSGTNFKTQQNPEFYVINF